ncbi:MAG: hypothetical protein LBU23_03620 [Planctomycetota bacterium]|nr:hypothetical protein [Planctomycetota bacterium]
MFSFIRINWRGKPLISYETIVNLISRITTCKGPRVMCKLDKRRYPIGKSIDKKEMTELKISPAAFHGNWNYTIEPR